ncbi:centromere protein S [Sphaerodactylus townsendi]|uniref:centromere protein S n=1 Tax=Sphaerodactylus townsendi TaxID=933632 RepID=UPI00202725E1|nr:centromere protein S [Sphaerodactylus townsendi]
MARRRESEETDEHFSDAERLKAAVHFTVAGLCEEVAEDKGIQFSKQAVAAISEITFRQCDSFAQDLEMFAKHAKRITVKPEDVKLLCRRSNSLLKYITHMSEELTLKKAEGKAKKKKTSSRTSDELAGRVAADSEDSNMA